MATSASDNHDTNSTGWLESSGLPHILRTLGLAVQPAKLGIALAAIILTCVWGTVLDSLWTGVSRGVELDAIARLVEAREHGRPFSESIGEHGVFEVWGAHQRRCIAGLLGSSVSAMSVAARTTAGTFADVHAVTSPLGNLANMTLGVWWLVRYHSLYAVLFGAVGLLIWSLAGGALCRMAAVQFARDARPTLQQATAFARDRLLGGFFLAPCFPLGVVAVTIVVMFLGGIFLGIPFLGDLIGGLAFSLAILGGFVAAVLLVGLAVGGSLLWPAIAVEGSDAFDAFSRSLAYTLTKPWKTLLYGVIAIVFAAICWVVVNLFTFFAMTFTRVVVGFGTAPFGWWGRGEEGDMPNKLERIWPTGETGLSVGGPDVLYSAPNWGELPWYECISAGLIAIHVLLVIGLLWSFLASFYFCGSTVVYCLLRRDVDVVSLEEVYLEEDTPTGETGSPGVATTPTKPSGDVSLPVTGGSAAEGEGRD